MTDDTADLAAQTPPAERRDGGSDIRLRMAALEAEIESIKSEFSDHRRAIADHRLAMARLEGLIAAHSENIAQYVRGQRQATAVWSIVAAAVLAWAHKEGMI